MAKPVCPECGATMNAVSTYRYGKYADATTVTVCPQCGYQPDKQPAAIVVDMALVKQLSEATERAKDATAQVDALTKERDEALATIAKRQKGFDAALKLLDRNHDAVVKKVLATLADMKIERDDATAQVEMLAGVVREFAQGYENLVEFGFFANSPDYGCEAKRLTDKAHQALSSLPHAGERWSKMVAVCEAAKPLFSDCQAAPPETGLIGIHDSCGACHYKIYTTCRKRPFKEALAKVQP